MIQIVVGAIVSLVCAFAVYSLLFAQSPGQEFYNDNQYTDEQLERLQSLRRNVDGD